MQRQSLGSPSTKHLLHETSHNNHHLHSPSSSSSSLSIVSTSLINEPEEKEEVKKLKLKPKCLLTSHENYIHLIPILTLLCFLILYLSSHHPTQNDLAQFNGFNRLHNNPEDLGENSSISELEGIVEIKKGDILAVRSLKNLIRQDKINQPRRHRKIADF